MMFIDRKRLIVVFNRFRTTNSNFRIAALVILFAVHGDSISQNAPDTAFKSIFPKGEDGIQYEKVFEVDSVTKKDLILRIKEWAIKSFSSQKAALQTEDTEAGFLVYQGTINKTYNIPKGWGFGLLESEIRSVDYETRFAISFYVKDYKFKMVIDKIELDAVSAFGIWMPNSTIGSRPINNEPLPIEKAGNIAIADYKANPNQKKYLIRLNYTATLWRDIHKQMLLIIESINQNVATKKKSPFEF